MMMNNTGRAILTLAALAWLQTAVSSESPIDVQEECIQEPVFEGKVCTLQANRNAAVGVILVHGLNGSMDDWKNTLPALARNFHVVAFDLPGFGKSDKGSKDYSPTTYARLGQFLADRYFPRKPFHIVGHSMGGATALRFAALRPLRFQRLVLIDAAGILHPLVLSKFQAGSMVERVSGVKQARGLAERVSGKVLELADKLPIKPDDIVNTPLGRDAMLQGGPEKIAALALSGENFSYAVATVTEPTLIIWGDSDLTVPLRTGEVLAARMPRARLEVIADAAHEPMKEQPEKVNALVTQHLLADESELAGQYARHHKIALQASDRIGTCSNESNKIFEGEYQSIDIRDCSSITIRNARVGRVTVYNSRVTLLDTDIAGSEEGLLANYSDITITNGDIEGEVAVHAIHSRLDLAGVRLKGSRDAVKAVGSKLVFSISQVHSPHSDGALHDYRSMVDGVL